MEYIDLQQSAKITGRSVKTIQRHLDKLPKDEKENVSKYGNSEKGNRIRLVRKEWLYKYWKIKDADGTGNGQQADTPGQQTDTKGHEEKTAQVNSEVLRIKDEMITELREDKKKLQSTVESMQMTVNGLVKSEQQTKMLLGDLQFKNQQLLELETGSVEEKESKVWLWVGVGVFAFLIIVAGAAAYWMYNIF
ncbi:MAG: hypothetical protein COC01_07570 [Bacteroidetes bacterium]|nr:MAG: hypothetical protein COC01_07570 [Bacteroidota bacterium]